MGYSYFLLVKLSPTKEGMVSVPAKLVYNLNLTSFFVFKISIVKLYNSPFRLVDFLEEVKHEKDDGDNFTEQTQTICFTTVLCWIIKCGAVDKCVGQQC